MKKKEVFGFRKNKAVKTLCGAVLGAAFLTSTMQVRADEVVSDTNSPINTEMVGTGKCSDQIYLKLKGQPVRHLKRVRREQVRQMAV